MGELAVMSHKGDTKLIWDVNNEPEVASARRTFDELRGKGYVAFRVTGKDGEKGEQITAFDPNAARIILAPQMRGGG